MEDRFYPNRPYELSEENDLFGTYYKAEAILNVLDNTNNYLNKNNILALYGVWGSGKTSVVDHIERNVENYKCIKFEAWRYENDVNLALSLFEMISDEIANEDRKFEKTIKDVKISAKTLFSFTKHLILNTEISLLGVKLALGKSGQEAIEEMTSNIEKVSYYSDVKKFNSGFKKLLEEYREHKSKKLLIFVDDLDRCDPSKVLDLLSAIKHFFSDSEDVVYFCPIDKNAVSQAINVRYNNVITAEEYLEKIFDISFNMPEENNMDCIVKDFYSKICTAEELIKIDTKLLSDFFKYINFINPRKIKKVFNKYIILLDLFRNFNKSEIIIKSRANILRKDIFHVITVIYIIILYEFYKPTFYELLEFESKIYKSIDLGDTNEVSIMYSNKSLGQYMDNERERGEFIILNDITPNKLLDDQLSKEFFSFLLAFYPDDLLPIKLPKINFQLANSNHSLYQKAMHEEIQNLKKNIQKSNKKILSKFLEFILDTAFTGKGLVEKPIYVLDIITLIKMYL